MSRRVSLPGADELFRTTGGGMGLQPSSPAERRRKANGEPRVPAPAGESDPSGPAPQPGAEPGGVGGRAGRLRAVVAGGGGVPDSRGGPGGTCQTRGGGGSSVSGSRRSPASPYMIWRSAGSPATARSSQSRHASASSR